MAKGVKKTLQPSCPKCGEVLRRVFVSSTGKEYWRCSGGHEVVRKKKAASMFEDRLQFLDSVADLHGG